jgi:hypothetical protein
MRELRVKTYRVVVVEETRSTDESTAAVGQGSVAFPLELVFIHRRVVAEGPFVPEDAIPVVCRLLRQLAPVFRVGGHFRRALSVVTTNLKGNS